MREERGERREERGERREEKRERREERGEEREERGEKREEEKEEKGMTPDLRLLSGFARWGVIIIACTCHVSAFGFVAPICSKFIYVRWIEEFLRVFGTPKYVFTIIWAT